MLLLPLFVLPLVVAGSHSRSFKIEGNEFLMDGKPFRYISGSMHYNRVLRSSWPDRLAKMKAAGLDAVEFYVPWNLHETSPGNFEQMDLLTDFIEEIQRTGLLAILRAGPYICGEWDSGGFPLWFAAAEGLQVRRSNGPYLQAVQRWFAKMLPAIKPYLYANGGPIIMMQVENEYGYYPSCDKNYMNFLANLTRRHLGDEILLFTVDGNQEHLLKCGAVQGLFATVDFGVGNNESVQASFALQRKYNGNKGPLVNTEFYPGWFDSWGKSHQTRDTDDVVETMKLMYEAGASFNFYMFHGGTNFGYWNGVVHDFDVVTTSYDYDAPISESGDLTEKYWAIRQTIHEITGKELLPVPPDPVKTGYGIVKLRKLGPIWGFLDLLCTQPMSAPFPKPFEDFTLRTGFIVYETVFQGSYAKNLSISWVRDWAYVLQDGILVGKLNRSGGNMRLDNNKRLKRLLILVQQAGRPQDRLESKGIGNVTIDGLLQSQWKMYPLDLGNFFSHERLQTRPKVAQNSEQVAFENAMRTVHARAGELPRLAEPTRRRIHRVQDFHSRNNIQGQPGSYDFSEIGVQGHRAHSGSQGSFVPSIFHGTFPASRLEDTFFDPTGWGNGQVLINGFNIGRYWPLKGPQVTLYVPKDLLRPVNTVVIFELEKPGLCDDEFHCAVRFQRNPIISGPVGY